MTSEATNLEEALAAVEADADATIKALAAATKAARRVKAAAAVGQIRELEQFLANASGLAEAASEAVGVMERAWQFDVREWFASGDYARELLAAAAAGGVSAYQSDDRILSYPAIVQVLADATLSVDRQKDRRVRPSVAVRHLAALQQRPPKFKPEAFIESLAGAYDYVVGAKGLRPGAPAKLVDLHRVLTLLPGTARDYTRQEFARDLYLLDQSEVVEVKDGRRMSLPASALTRGSGILTTVTRGGQTKIYVGISFQG
jgi:hypothetical protein